jgi:hypothetical protein
MKCYTILIKALYDQPFSIDSISTLNYLASLADDYDALPRISRAISASPLFDDPYFHAQMPRRCLELLKTSRILRDEVLFRDCIILATGPLRKPLYLNLDDPILYAVAERAYGKIARKIDELFEYGSDAGVWYPRHKLFERLNAEIKDKGKDAVDIGWLINGSYDSVPVLFRKLLRQYGPKLPKNFKMLLEALFVSNLVLDGSGCIPGDPGIFQDWILCTEVSDEELPWDVHEKEW